MSDPAAADAADIADLRRDARKIYYAAVHAAEPAPLVHAALLNAPELRAPSRIHVLAVGKAAPGMAMAALETLADRVAACLVIATQGSIEHAGDAFREMHADNTRPVTIMTAAHPIPDESSVTAARAVLNLVALAEPRDVIVALISGGASALIALPAGDITLEDYRTATSQLMKAGADIVEMNCVRKHIDAVKGGNLARAAHGRNVLGLLISDVAGNDAGVIGSGPFSMDNTSAEDALRVLERYQLTSHTPSSVVSHLRELVRTHVSNTWRADSDETHPVRLQIIADNALALDAAAAYARRLGYDAARIAEPISGAARQAGADLAAQLRNARPATSACIIAGGETTVDVRGSGVGGRNQELALAAALQLDGVHDVVLLSGGTDGIDGPTDAAGAIVDGASCARMRDAAMDPVRLLENNDSHTALRAAGDLLVTGATGTNVMDVQVLLHRGVRDSRSESAVVETSARRAP